MIISTSKRCGLQVYVEVFNMQIDLSFLLGQFLGPIGTLVLCLFILYTGYKGYWVFGWYAAELRKRNERLENRLDRLSGESKSVVSVAEKLATAAEQQVETTNG